MSQFFISSSFFIFLASKIVLYSCHQVNENHKRPLFPLFHVELETSSLVTSSTTLEGF